MDAIRMLRAGSNKHACKNIRKVVIKGGQRKRKSKTRRLFSVKFYNIRYHKDQISSCYIRKDEWTGGRTKTVLLIADPHNYEDT
jgi:hypothetical protein